MDGRARFIEEHQGQRYKLLTEDGNSIDTMAVDRRGKWDLQLHFKIEMLS